MHVPSLARRLGAATLVLALGAGLTACSGDDTASSSASDSGSDSSSDDSTVDDSTPDEGDDQSGEAAAVSELAVDDFYPSIMAAMRDAGSFRFETTSDSQGQTQTMSGQARFDDDGMAMKASGTGAQAIEMILLDQVMYMKAPGMGAGDKWLKVDLSDPDSLFGMMGKATDPEVMFKAMETPKKLELVGTEEVDGVETNHYRITLDPQQYVDAMDFPAAMADMLPKELVTEMWVDGDDLPRRFAQTLEIPAVGGGAATSSTTEGTYSDYGSDVEISAPPAAQVTQLPGM